MHNEILDEVEFQIAITLAKRHVYGSRFVLLVAQNRLYPDIKVHRANMGPIWGRQDPGGPHAGPMNFAFWVYALKYYCTGWDYFSCDCLNASGEILGLY